MLKGIDVSAYQVNVPWGELIKNAGIGFAIIKGDQAVATANHVSLARTAGVPVVGLYFWQDPTIPVSLQVQCFAEDIREYKPDFIWLDVEQWWASWTEWSKLWTKPPQITEAQVPKLTSVQISNHGKGVLTGLKALFPDLLIGLYTGTWFINKYSPDMETWMDEWPLWMAHYFDGGAGDRKVTWAQLAATPPWPFAVQMPPGMVWDIWQYSSTMRTPAQDARYDWNVYNGTADQLAAWINKKEISMTALYKQTVAQANRAKILTYRADQKINIPLADLGIDGVILPMGGMDKWDGSHMRLYSEPSFGARVEQFVAAGIPVIGKFNLDAGYWLKEQHTAPEIENQTIRDNPVIKAVLDAWCMPGWTFDQVLSKQAKYHPISALMLSMVETDGWPAGTTVDNGWQARTFTHAVNHVKALIYNGMAPDIPLILYTGPWWLNLYDKDGSAFRNELNNRKSWLYLSLGQWTLTSTAIFGTLEEIFKFRPADSFTFSQYPDGYFERILMHEFSGEKQRVSYITDASGNPTEINLSLWNDTREEMYKFLNFSPVPPTPDPEPDPSGKRIFDMLMTLHAEVSMRKPGDKSPTDRSAAILLTEIEKLIGFTDYYLRDL